MTTPPNNAAREFWIELDSPKNIDGTAMVYIERVDGLDSSAFHVIEHSAYQELKEENERLVEHIAGSMCGYCERKIMDGQDAAATQQLLERAVKALEFYADGEGDVLDWDLVNNPSAIQDKGKTARAFLAEIGKIK